MIPWETVCIDLVGPYTVTDKFGNDRTLLAMTFVDPATGWFEITEIPEKSSARISHIFNSTWLARYPRPKKSSLIMGMSSRRISYLFSHDFAIKPTPTTIKNPQANAILERLHQVLGDMLRTKNLEQYIFGDIDPWCNSQEAELSHQRTILHSPSLYK